MRNNYKVIVEKITTGEFRNIIIKDCESLLELTYKISNLDFVKDIKSTGWRIIKIEIDFSSSQKTDTSKLDSSICPKKYIIENTTDGVKLIKIDYENNKLYLSVYDREDIVTSFGIFLKLYQGDYCDIVPILYRTGITKTQYENDNIEEIITNIDSSVKEPLCINRGIIEDELIISITK